MIIIESHNTTLNCRKIMYIDHELRNINNFWPLYSVTI